MTEAFADSEALWIITFVVGSLSLAVMSLLFLVFIHHFASDRVRNRNRKRFQQATEFLLPAVVTAEHDLLQVAIRARRKFGERAVGLVLRQAWTCLKGQYATRVTTALEDLGVVDRLIKQSRSRREWKRISAVRALGDCGGPIALDRLMECASDASGMVRRFARDALIRQGTHDSIHSAIESFLKDLAKGPCWHHAFYARLAAVAPNELIRMIETTQLGETEGKLAIEALADAGSPDLQALAVRLLQSEEIELRATATRALGKIGRVEDLPALRSMLGDEEWFIRSSAARSIEWLLIAHREDYGDGDLRQTALALSSHLLDSKWWVRANSARALTHCGRFGIDVLFRTADGHDRYARDAALAALALTNLPADQKALLDETIARVLAEEAGSSGRGSEGVVA